MDTIFKKKTLIFVEAHKLDQFIAAQLGLKTFEGTLESNNDSQHTYRVTAEPDSSAKYNVRKLEKIIAIGGCEHWSLHLVLDDLCRAGVIEPGEYLVNVSW